MAQTVKEFQKASGEDQMRGIVANKIGQALQRADRYGLSSGLLDDSLAIVRSYQLRNAGNGNSSQAVAGWSIHEAVPGEFRVGTDHQIVHTGKRSLFVRSLKNDPSGPVNVYQQFDADKYRGKRVRLAVFLRCTAVKSAKLWISFTTEQGEVDQQVEVSGTDTWKESNLVVDVPGDAGWIEFGILMQGSGTLWADDFSFRQVTASVPLKTERVQPENLGFSEPPKVK
jgi:hypothetical protein